MHHQRCAPFLQGPADTPYEGGVFEVLLNVPEQYPLMPPAVRYRTKIFHPNVHFKVRVVGEGVDPRSMHARVPRDMHTVGQNF